MVKGKYLIILNQNTFFINNNDLKKIYNEIEDNKIDILEFNLYKIYPNNYISLYKCKHFLSSFNLTKIKYNTESWEIDIKIDLLTNKVFKTLYFKNVLNVFNIHKIKESINYYYNNIFNFIFEKVPHSFKYIKNINAFINDSFFDKIQFNDFMTVQRKLINETIFYINFLYDNSKDTYEDKKKVLNEFFNVLSIIFNKFTKIEKPSIKLINKFFNCKYISKQKKILLEFYLNSLK